jgi:pyrroloquinoline-quinone synthase
MKDFMAELDELIDDGKKMKSSLYQVILEGNATEKLLQNFLIHRYPVKELWTRHLLSIASRIEDYELRCSFLENAYEEETGFSTNSKRHLESFVDVGLSLGLNREEITHASKMPETERLMEHNVNACNNTNNHFTSGIASVIYLMEGQPPIVNSKGQSMEAVMKDIYKLPAEGYEFFTHHASVNADDDCPAPSELEETHSSACRNILEKYCNSKSLKEKAKEFVKKSIRLRHEHFDAIQKRFYNENDAVFRYTG